MALIPPPTAPLAASVYRPDGHLEFIPQFRGLQLQSGEVRDVNPSSQQDNSAGQRHGCLFQPSKMLNLQTRARRENPTLTEIQQRIAAGVSPNYKGDYTLARNRPANIPQEENCSVWITGLPRDVTMRELLGAIRDTGRIWATVIQSPTIQHGTAAAKVTFFTAAAAQTLLARANRTDQPGFQVGGHEVRVRHDRNRVAEANEPVHHTRVISVAGPRDIVTVANLMALFDRSFVYQLAEVDVLVMGRALNVLEFHFGSYRCQAQWAWQTIRNDPFLQQHGVRVKFERDPCDV